MRRGGRVVDGTGLENRRARKGIGGSNPSLSAIKSAARSTGPNPLWRAARPYSIAKYRNSATVLNHAIAEPTSSPVGGAEEMLASQPRRRFRHGAAHRVRQTFVHLFRQRPSLAGQHPAPRLRRFPAIHGAYWRSATGAARSRRAWQREFPKDQSRTLRPDCARRRSRPRSAAAVGRAGLKQRVNNSFRTPVPTSSSADGFGHVIMRLDILDHRAAETVIPEQRISAAEHQRRLAAEFGEIGWLDLPHWFLRCAPLNWPA